MKNTFEKRLGFTLIELLVVVLIIGILAAIALPQYKKAIMASKAAEAKLIISDFEKQVELYLLTNGWPDATEWFTGRWNKEKIDFMEGHQWGEVEQYGRKGEYSFLAQCSASSCYLNLMYCPNYTTFPAGNPGYDKVCGNPHFQFQTRKTPTSGKWTRTCSRSDMCKSLTKGW